MQSRRQSLIETCTSLFVGFVVSYFTTLYALPCFGYPVKAGETFWITMIFTVLSFIRGYALRRLFNHLHKGDFQ